MDKINSNKSIFMSKRKVIVIGAGAAGMMAAGQAAENGADTLLLEKMKRPGRKLCITGKGRCNITNAGEIAEFIEHFGRTGSFLRQAFSRFFNTDLMDFFKELGLEVVTERGGRVFPASGKAPDVLSVLLQWLKRRGVNIMNSTPVDELVIRRGKVRGVVCLGREIPCEAVVLATGGASYPATGSAGDGYRIGECAGHSLVPVRPALVPLETSGDSAKKMAGLSLKNISVRLIVNSRKRKEAFGEMMFAKFGVTGPVILLLSGEAVDALRDGSKVSLSIDLKPALSEKKLDARLLRDLAARGKEPADSFLRGLLPREMVPVCLSLTEIPRDCLAAQISAKRRGRLRAWLKDFRLEVTRSRPFDEAIVTAGGIETREINPRTLESRRTKGLFIAGELLDIQADTGGYNLQAAFSTGWLAGRSAAHGTL
jgi:hypothetical protein